MSGVRGPDGKFLPKNAAVDQDVEPAAVVEEQPEPGAVSIEDIVGGDFVSDDGDGDDAVITPGEEAPGAPAGDDGAVVPPVEDEEPKIVQLDGGGFQLGEFKGNTIEELVLAVEKGRRGAESLIGKRKEELAAELEGANPFLTPEAEGDEDEWPEDEIDGDVFAGSIASNVVQTLAQQGLIGGQQGAQVDPFQAAMQSVQAADDVVAALSSPDIAFVTPEEKQKLEQSVRAALAAVLTHAPGAVDKREALLAAWGQVNPFEAARASMRLEQAEQTFVQQQTFEQQQAEAQAAFEAEATIAGAYQDAEQAFVERNPDAAQYAAGIDAWFNQPGNAVLAQQARGNPAAIYSLFQHALDEAKRTASVMPAGVAPVAQQAYAQAAPQTFQLPDGRVVQVVGQQGAQGLPAGISVPTSEHGGMMQGVGGPGGIDTGAVYRADQAQMRDLAGLETGVAVDGISVSLTNQNSPETAGVSFADLLGVGVVGE